MTDTTPPTETHILVVDDEPDVAEIFTHWLEQEFTAHSVTNGPDALEYLTTHDDVDVVLLDRRMPSMSGDEVLEEIREQEYDCKVAMITAVDPDFNIIEMGFDDYITKPADKDDLVSVVNSLLARKNYGDELTRYYSLLSKRAALEEEYPQHQLENKDEFLELQAEINALEDELREKIDFGDQQSFIEALRNATVKTIE